MNGLGRSAWHTDNSAFVKRLEYHLESLQVPVTGGIRLMISFDLSSVRLTYPCGISQHPTSVLLQVSWCTTNRRRRRLQPATLFSPQPIFRHPRHHSQVMLGVVAPTSSVCNSASVISLVPAWPPRSRVSRPWLITPSSAVSMARASSSKPSE